MFWKDLARRFLKRNQYENFSVVPFIYEAKVTILESSSYIDIMDHLVVFAELKLLVRR